MPGVTREQIEKAKEVNIEDYILSHEPQNVKRIGHTLYLKDHDSLRISNGLWKWESQGIGGKNVVDYLIKVRGYEFTDAVRHLAGDMITPVRTVAPKARPPTMERPAVEHLTLIGQYRNDYHICQFAELMERNGSKCEVIPGQKPMLNILAAKYGEPLQDVEIPMTKAAVVRLVGGAFTTEDVRGDHIMLRGKDGVAVCKSEDGALAPVHPYWAQTLKRELGTIAAPLPEKADFLGKIDKLKDKAAQELSAPNPKKSRDGLE